VQVGQERCVAEVAAVGVVHGDGGQPAEDAGAGEGRWRCGC
jgi:hypothetical protein